LNFELCGELETPMTDRLMPTPHIAALLPEIADFLIDFFSNAKKDQDWLVASGVAAPCLSLIALWEVNEEARQLLDRYYEAQAADIALQRKR
jgi:hypothetical protein